MSNVDDIESYVQSREAQSGTTYLAAIDLPASDRAEVLNELAMMGISAGSMFPGLDGVCEEWRSCLFGFEDF